MPAPLSRLDGKSALVTGVTSGIGKEAARGLARLGATVIGLARSAKRGEAARRELAAGDGDDRVHLVVADVSSQDSIRAAAREVHDRWPVLDLLVNNAGVWLNARETTADGIERTWATNVLGSFLLTELLLEPLRRSAHARVVNVASELARDLDLDDVQFERRPYSGVAAYAQSKQANRMFTWALSRRLEGTTVRAHAMHPGGVNTGLFRKSGGFSGRLVATVVPMFTRSPEQGADTILWLAAAPEAGRSNGRFWVDRHERPCRFAADVDAQERLWLLCEKMTSAVPT